MRAKSIEVQWNDIDPDSQAIILRQLGWSEWQYGSRLVFETVGDDELIVDNDELVVEEV